MLPRPRILLAALFAVFALAAGASLNSADQPEILPVSEIQPGMKGTVYTILAGDEIKPIDLEVLGVLPNAFGPKQDIILVELKGPEAEHAGVAAGMSGSPVFINGKLVGALSLKLGIFTKEAIGGVTPIQSMLAIEKALPPPTKGAAAASQTTASPPALAPVRLPDEFAQRIGVGNGNFLTPIETPLIATGFYPQALAQYSGELAGFGLTAVEGGTAAPRPDDAEIKPGSMVGMVLVRGDLSLEAGCTVTRIEAGRVFVCGHPLFGFGNVDLPMARAHVVTTLASALASTKIMTTGGTIGTFTQDRLTAVIGQLGAGPPMMPLDLSVTTPTEEKQFHFEILPNSKITPLLVALTTFNGVVGNTAYTEGTTFQMNGTIEIEGHSPIQLQNMFAPTDIPVPDGFFVAGAVQGIFSRIFMNPYERPHIQKISLRLTSLPQRRWASIDSAWSEKSEAHPGETIRVKVLLRPYRGAPFIQEVPITIPAQAVRGNLRILVSDADVLNRVTRAPTFGLTQLNGLEEMIQLLNRERHNDRLYVALLQPTPTLLIEDKELPNVPLSEINVLDQRRMPGAATLLWESEAGEWSVGMNQVIAGQQYLIITVK